MTTSGGARGGTTYSTIRGTAESIVALPYQLGYRPGRSLVMVCLQMTDSCGHGAPTGTVRLVARADLGPPGDASDIMQALGTALRQATPDVVVLVAFEGPDDDSTELLQSVQGLVERAGAAVDRAARVRDGQWLSLQEPDGSAPRWRDLPDAADVPVVADFVLQGRSPLEGREALAALFEPVRPVVAAAARHVLENGCDATITPGEADTAMSLLGDTLRCVGDDLPELRPETVVDLALLLHDVLVRDAVLARLAPQVMRLDEVPPDCAALVRRTLPALDTVDGNACRRLARLSSVVPTPIASPLVSVCAYLAWFVGEGTIANLAVERALQLDPSYSLARLVDRALQHAVPPPGRAGRRRSGQGGCPPAA